MACLGRKGEDEAFFFYALLALSLLCPLTFLHLSRFVAPYGRHYRRGWDPSISPTLGWILMERPTLWLTLLLLPFGRNRSNPVALAVLSFFLLHYTNRTLIYPLLIRNPARGKSGEFSLTVALAGFIFNLLNAYLQARWVSHYGDYPEGWLRSPQFVTGVAVFAMGMAANIWADRKLVALKKEACGGYKIPHGGLFEWVSCPNYFTEMVEWFGWAVLTWSPAGVAFVLYTAANLVPRAAVHHDWYLQKFYEDYPMSRMRVIPFVYLQELRKYHQTFDCSDFLHLILVSLSLSLSSSTILHVFQLKLLNVVPCYCGSCSAVCLYHVHHFLLLWFLFSRLPQPCASLLHRICAMGLRF